MSDGFEILISKLDSFIRKYYKNQLIKGGILVLSLMLGAVLFVASLEYFGRFSIVARTILFYTLLTFGVLIIIKFLIIPFLGLLRIGKTISRKQASSIISSHFPEIKDKLFNTIELHNLEDMAYSKELILASITQRIEELKPIPFVRAVSFKSNFRFLKYLIAVVILFVSTIALKPSIINEGSERILNHNIFYKKPAPFSFTINNDSLIAEKGDDYILEVSVTGDYAPEQLFISIRGNKSIMQKVSNIEYKYEFRSVNNDIDFMFTADDIESENYRLVVLPPPVIIDFILSVDVPDYTGESDEILNNIGDVTVPEGTRIKWEFTTQDIENLSMIFGDDTAVCSSKNDEAYFEYTDVFMKNTKYSINTSNKYVTKTDVLKYFINVVPDIFPDINVVAVKDSVKPFIYYFIGNISDDYGFSSLSFNYSIDDEQDTSIFIPVGKNIINEKFYYAYDFSILVKGEDNKIEYYFEVFDNDKINGFKSSRSNLFVYQLPSKGQMDSIRDDQSEKMEKLMKESMDIANQLKKDVKKLKEEKIKNELSDWEKSKLIEDIVNKEQRLENILDQLSNENKVKNEIENTLSEDQKEILEKQDMIQELLDNILSDELKDLIEELKKLQEEMKPEDMDKLTDDLDLSIEDLKDQLDRNLELLKKYEIEEKVNRQIEDLKQLSKDQEELSEKSADKESDPDSLKNEQEKQQEKFEKLMDEYKELQEDNKKLESPMNLDDFEQQKKDIKDNFSQDKESLNKGNNKKASKGQSQNSKKLDKMSEDMQKMMDSNSGQQAGENMEDLQQIIENLVTFSFDQERIMQTLKEKDTNDPSVNTLIDEQNKIEDDFVIINDSITKLAMRVPQLGPMVNRELVSINKKLIRIQDEIETRRINEIVKEQQFVMTSANNLALLLSEALEAMQKQMSQDMSGEQQCQKQGQGKPSMSQMKGMQQSLKQQLEGLIDQMKSGKGDKSKQEGDAINKRIAQMLAQQEIFSQMLKEMSTKSGLSPETQKLLNEINKLAKDNEKELANKNITPKLLERQKLILSRLLEAEKSENKREIENKRESKENRLELLSNPDEILDHNKDKNNFNELFEKKNVSLKTYYNKKYKKYIETLKENE